MPYSSQVPHIGNLFCLRHTHRQLARKCTHNKFLISPMQSSFYSRAHTGSQQAGRGQLASPQAYPLCLSMFRDVLNATISSPIFPVFSFSEIGNRDSELNNLATVTKVHRTHEGNIPWSGSARFPQTWAHCRNFQIFGNEKTGKIGQKRACLERFLPGMLYGHLPQKDTITTQITDRI